MPGVEHAQELPAAPGARRPAARGRPPRISGDRVSGRGTRDSGGAGGAAPRRGRRLPPAALPRRAWSPPRRCRPPPRPRADGRALRRPHIAPITAPPPARTPTLAASFSSTSPGAETVCVLIEPPSSTVSDVEAQKLREPFHLARSRDVGHDAGDARALQGSTVRLSLYLWASQRRADTIPPCSCRTRPPSRAAGPASSLRRV